MLYLECKPDEVLARGLGLTRRGCLHFSGKDEVFARLKRERGMVAMVDEDPKSTQPPYRVRELKVMDEQHGIRELRDEKREHRVIELRPRLEEWVIDAAKASGVSMGEGLSERGNELHREITARLRSFGGLIDRLLAAGSPQIEHLRQLLRA